MDTRNNLFTRSLSLVSIGAISFMLGACFDKTAQDQSTTVKVNFVAGCLRCVEGQQAALGGKRQDQTYVNPLSQITDHTASWDDPVTDQGPSLDIVGDCMVQLGGNGWSSSGVLKPVVPGAENEYNLWVKPLFGCANIDQCDKATEDKDCGAGWECDEQENGKGECVPKPGGKCDEDSDCPTGYECTSNGMCVPGDGCNTDADCPDGQTCNENGECEGGGETGGCNDNDDCTDGKVCKNGTCEPPPSEVGPLCLVNYTSVGFGSGLTKWDMSLGELGRDNDKDGICETPFWESQLTPIWIEIEMNNVFLKLEGTKDSESASKRLTILFDHAAFVAAFGMASSDIINVTVHDSDVGDQMTFKAGVTGGKGQFNP